MNEQEVTEYGRALASELTAGAVVALIGDLGAGKTTLSKAIAAGLGVTDDVTSPTFTLINEYDGGRLPLYHFDVYRLEDPADLEELGYEEYFYGRGVTLVEWADLVLDYLPADAIVLELGYGAGDNERTIERKLLCESS
jgi:tRNA threonylcarbamoyladenosine biosynthesis protein TsaE